MIYFKRCCLEQIILSTISRLPTFQCILHRSTMPTMATFSAILSAIASTVPRKVISTKMYLVSVRPLVGLEPVSPPLQSDEAPMIILRHNSHAQTEEAGIQLFKRCSTKLTTLGATTRSELISTNAPTLDPPQIHEKTRFL